MAKKVAGKKYFYALGQRAHHRHFKVYYHTKLNYQNSPKPKPSWPLWAQHAFECGLYGYNINDLDGSRHL